MKETYLVSAVMQYLKLQKIYAWRQNTGAMKDPHGRLVRFGFPGLSDILGMYEGRFLAIECKVGKNKQTPAQLAFRADVVNHGGIYILAYSLDDVIEGLK